MGKNCLKVAKSLAHENAASVSWIAAVEREQQVQCREAKDINLWAAAWACTGKYVCKAIAVGIVNAIERRL